MKTKMFTFSEIALHVSVFGPIINESCKRNSKLSLFSNNKQWSLISERIRPIKSYIIVDEGKPYIYEWFSIV